MDITVDLLIADGWKKTEDEAVPLEKEIENRNPINNDPEDSGIKLVVHRMYNAENFAILLPTGAMLNFVANSMEELKTFENAIDFYDPEF
jgi:hypothetical protein